MQNCPLFYTSPNAPGVQDILGAWLLSILDGQWRYAHISGLRGDSVSPQILGMKRILSDESLRRALMHLAPCPEQARTDAERARREAQLARSEQWMDHALRESLGEALMVAWILDCDTTIKVLYGHQAGAVLGYNPQKPGRPSHSIHTDWIANVRLALDAEVQPGNSTAAKYSLPRLIDLLHSLPPEQRPRLVVRFNNTFTYQAISRSNFFHRKTTGCSFISLTPFRIRALSSSRELTRICRRKLRAILEKAHSIRFSQEPCFGV